MRSGRGCRSHRRLPSRAAEARRTRMEGTVALQPGEDALLHRQRPEGLLSLLLVRQARRHLRLRHGDGRLELSRGGGEARRRRRASHAEARPAIRAHSQGAAWVFYDALEAAARPLRGGAWNARGPRCARLCRMARAHLGNDEGVPHRLRAEREGRAQSDSHQTRIHRGAAPRGRASRQARRRSCRPTIASATGSPSRSSMRQVALIAFGARALDAAPSRNI